MNDFNSIDFSKVISSIQRNGDGYAELFCERTMSTAIICEDDKIEKIISGIDAGIGLRLVRDFRTAYAYTNDPQDSHLMSIGEKLSDSLSHAPSSMTSINIKPIKGLISLPVEIDPDTIDISKKIEHILAANETARSAINIRQVRVIYRDTKKEVIIVNSEGIYAEETRFGSIFAVQVVASKDGVIQTGYEPVGGTVGFELFDEYSPQQVALAAVERANLMIKAKPAPAGEFPVVLSYEAGGTMIHEAVGHGLEADLAGKQLSVYSGKRGQNWLRCSMIRPFPAGAVPLFLMTRDPFLSGPYWWIGVSWWILCMID
jgi:TldD protein